MDIHSVTGELDLEGTVSIPDDQVVPAPKTRLIGTVFGFNAANLGQPYIKVSFLSGGEETEQIERYAYCFFGKDIPSDIFPPISQWNMASTFVAARKANPTQILCHMWAATLAHKVRITASPDDEHHIKLRLEIDRYVVEQSVAIRTAPRKLIV